MGKFCMTKAEAKGLIAFYTLQAINHPPQCECGKTPEGVATIHRGKTAEEYQQIVDLASQAD